MLPRLLGPLTILAVPKYQLELVTLLHTVEVAMPHLLYEGKERKLAITESDSELGDIFCILLIQKPEGSTRRYQLHCQKMSESSVNSEVIQQQGRLQRVPP